MTLENIVYFILGFLGMKLIYSILSVGGLLAIEEKERERFRGT